LKSIKNGFIKDLKYQYILEGVVGYRSQPNHFHLHLIKLK
jgi:hypothetical protein